MQFEKEEKENIILRVGEVLQKTYGEDYGSVLPMFADTDCRMPEVFKDFTVEQNKQLEDRFTYCINEAALKDTFEELHAFLKDTAEKLRVSYTNLRIAGYKWLTAFPCDDKDSFLNFGIYLAQAKIIGIDADKFYKKFTYTRKHGKRIFESDGTPIFHSLYAYSGVTSSEYVSDMFMIDEYGDKYVEVAGLYRDIVYVLRDTCWYVKSMDQQAKMRKLYPVQCTKSLMEWVDEVMGSLQRNAIDGNEIVPSEEDIKKAKTFLPVDIFKQIFTLDIPKLSTTEYHEIPYKYAKAFAVLVKVRMEELQGVDTIEADRVFAHVKNSKEKLDKICEARILLAHIGEFKKLEVEECDKKITKNVIKGDIAYMFYYWTGTTMSQTAFLETYYCAKCEDKKMHVAQSSLSTACKRFDKKSSLYAAFKEKASEILNNNLPTNAMKVSLEKNQTHKVKGFQTKKA